MITTRTKRRFTRCVWEAIKLESTSISWSKKHWILSSWRELIFFLSKIKSPPWSRTVKRTHSICIFFRIYICVCKYIAKESRYPPLKKTTLSPCRYKLAITRGYIKAHTCPEKGIPFWVSYYYWLFRYDFSFSSIRFSLLATLSYLRHFLSRRIKAIWTVNLWTNFIVLWCIQNEIEFYFILSRTNVNLLFFVTGKPSRSPKKKK